MELSVRIETAKPEDAAAMVGVHFAAVHQTAASFYPPAITNSWSRPISNERVERIQRAIESSSELFLVAKYVGSIVGFGSVVPRNNELRGLYVHPDYGRRGIGGQILSVLEQIAVEHGASCLQMDASVNAETFYIRQGYQAVEHGTHQLASGQEMNCVQMQKMLLY
jgi:putative acetyltransferase